MAETADVDKEIAGAVKAAAEELNANIGRNGRATPALQQLSPPPELTIHAPLIPISLELMFQSEFKLAFLAMDELSAKVSSSLEPRNHWPAVFPSMPEYLTAA